MDLPQLGARECEGPLDETKGTCVTIDWGKVVCVGGTFNLI